MVQAAGKVKRQACCLSLNITTNLSAQLPPHPRRPPRPPSVRTRNLQIIGTRLNVSLPLPLTLTLSLSLSFLVYIFSYLLLSSLFLLFSSLFSPHLLFSSLPFPPLRCSALLFSSLLSLPPVLFSSLLVSYLLSPFSSLLFPSRLFSSLSLFSIPSLLVSPLLFSPLLSLFLVGGRCARRPKTIAPLWLPVLQNMKYVSTLSEWKAFLKITKNTKMHRFSWFPMILESVENAGPASGF